MLSIVRHQQCFPVHIDNNVISQERCIRSCGIARRQFERVAEPGDYMIAGTVLTISCPCRWCTRCEDEKCRRKPFASIEDTRTHLVSSELELGFSVSKRGIEQR